MEREPLIFGEPQPRITTRQFRQRELGFQLSEIGAEAVMRSESEREMPGRVGTARVEPLRLTEDRPVSPGRREPQEKPSAFRQVHSCDSDGPRGDSAPHGHRRVVTQGLLDGA